jgi:hypothetical protein
MIGVDILSGGVIGVIRGRRKWIDWNGRRMAMSFAGGKVDPAEAGRKGAEARWRKVEPDGPVDVLEEMEALLQRPEEKDKTEFQKKLRQMYKEDFKEYMRELTAWRGRKRGEETGERGVGEGDDLGSEAALQLAAELVERWRKETGP